MRELCRNYAEVYNPKIYISFRRKLQNRSVKIGFWQQKREKLESEKQKRESSILKSRSVKNWNLKSKTWKLESKTRNRKRNWKNNILKLKPKKQKRENWNLPTEAWKLVVKIIISTKQPPHNTMFCEIRVLGLIQNWSCTWKIWV